MKMQHVSLTAMAAVLALCTSQASATLIGFDAEDGVLGTTLVVGSDPGALGGEFLDVANNTIPVTPDSTATYTADLPAGTYDLYVRFFVDAGGAVDDSFFAPSDFGVAPSLTVNQLDAFNAGFYTDVNGVVINGNIVDGGGNQEYYWINVSDSINNVTGNGATGVTFTTAGGIETIALATRESGLRIDALALGVTGTAFSEAELNAAVIPEPSAFAIGLLAMGAFGARFRRV